MQGPDWTQVPQVPPDTGSPPDFGSIVSSLNSLTLTGFGWLGTHFKSREGTALGFSIHPPLYH